MFRSILRRLFFVILICASLINCSNDNNDTPPNHSPDPRPSHTGPGIKRARPNLVKLEPFVTSGLNQAIGLAHANDTSNRLFVVEQGGSEAGKVRVIRNQILLKPALLEVSSNFLCRGSDSDATASAIGFSAGGEQGLLGLAFHPQYKNNGQLFISFTDARGDSVVARFVIKIPSADQLTQADLNTCLVIMRVDQDFANHNGGHILFGPDGFLYFGLGDGGSGNDPCNRAQTLNPKQLDSSGRCAEDRDFIEFNGGNFAGGARDSRALLGKMLRLNVDATTAPGKNELCGARADGSANYAVDTNNPFAGVDSQNACDEIWAYGLRNPWRFSFDRATGDLWLGDVGQSAWEEINFQSALLMPKPAIAINYGWKMCEGSHTRGECDELCPSDLNTRRPNIEYNNGSANCSSVHPSGCSVTGGYRYRGPDAALNGLYFFADYCTGDVWYSEPYQGKWTIPDQVSSIRGHGTIPAFGEDEQGRLYVISGAAIYRITAN